MPFGGLKSERVLILMGRRRDAELAHRLLVEAGFSALVCPDASALTRELGIGAGCAVITDEAIVGSSAAMLHDWVEAQPTWSDLPIIILTGKADETTGGRSTRELQSIFGNISFVERPFHPRTLASVARAAMRSRRRQYEARDLLDRYELLARELQHRTKNLLSVVLSIASATLREGGDGQEAFISRLHALAAAQDLLMEGNGQGAYLADIVQSITCSFGQRVAASGPDVHLSPTLAQGFALIVNELATNAAKHGALSRDGGRISILWTVGGCERQSVLEFRWQEQGGPPVVPPRRKSFGTVLLERAVATSGSRAWFDYASQGFGYGLSVELG